MEANDDMKVMRKALAMLVDACVSFHHFVENGLDGHYEAIPHYDSAAEDFLRCVDAAKSALSKPPRNCDVGTIEEQYQRYHATGEVYHTLTLANALAWAQEPYKKGEADEQ